MRNNCILICITRENLKHTHKKTEHKKGLTFGRKGGTEGGEGGGEGGGWGGCHLREVCRIDPIHKWLMSILNHANQHT